MRLARGRLRRLRRSLADDPVLLAQIKEQIEIGIKYQGYIDRQADEIERNEAQESTRLPEGIDYAEVRGLSFEARQKLTQFRPETIGQASRISGITPAAISLLMVHLKRGLGRRAGESTGEHRHAGNTPAIAMTGSSARGAIRHGRLVATSASGVRELGLDADRDAQLDKLLDYVALLAKWNAVYNLTAIRDPRQMLIQHILDSLSIVPHLAQRGPSYGARRRFGRRLARHRHWRSFCPTGR